MNTYDNHRQDPHHVFFPKGSQNVLRALPSKHQCKLAGYIDQNLECSPRAKQKRRYAAFLEKEGGGMTKR